MQTNQPPPNGFTNPYDEELLRHPDSLKKTSVRTSSAAHSKIQGAHGTHGTFQTTLNILTKKFVEQLIAHGLDKYNPEYYEYAVANCRIDLGIHPEYAAERGTGSTAAVPPSQDVHGASETHRGNDGLGASGLARESAESQPSAVDASGSPASGRGRGKGSVGPRGKAKG